MYSKRYYIIEWTAALFMMAIIAISIRLGIDFLAKVIEQVVR